MYFFASSLYIGGFYNGKLVSVISLSRENDNEWRLTRLTYNTNNDTIIKKSMNYFIDKYKPHKIEAFDDRRWVVMQTDSIYNRLGFDFAEILPPDYGYTKGQNDYINKEKLKDCHLSNDYYRIYDCGQYKYEWKNVN